jgi:hypothetical protein
MPVEHSPASKQYSKTSILQGPEPAQEEKKGGLHTHQVTKNLQKNHLPQIQNPTLSQQQLSTNTPTSTCKIPIGSHNFKKTHKFTHAYFKYHSS